MYISINVGYYVKMSELSWLSSSYSDIVVLTLIKSNCAFSFLAFNELTYATNYDLNVK